MPVAVSKLAHVGMFVMEKVSAAPFALLAAGTNAYELPATTETAGTPLIVGAVSGGGVDGDGVVCGAVA